MLQLSYENGMVDLFQCYLEQENKFKDFEINGIKCWHVLRWCFYYEILNEKEKGTVIKSEIGNASSSLSKVLYGSKMIKNAIIKNPFFMSKKDKKFLIISSPRKMRKEGQIIDPVLDPVFSILKGQYNYIERPDVYSHLTDQVENDVTFSDYFELLRLKNIIFKKYDLKKNELLKVEGLISEINNIFDVQLDNQKVIEKINSELEGFFTYYYSYKKLIKRLRPEVVIEVTHYDKAQLAVTKIAHENNIKVIELQHGFTGKFHLAYNCKNFDDYLPDTLLTYGDYWNQYTTFPSEMVAIGNCYLEKEVIKSKNNRNTILVISQGPVADVLIDAALEIYDYIKKTGKNYKIVYKLHPNEIANWKTNYKKLVNSGITVVGNEVPLYEIFANASIQIGVYSTALLEGMAFDLKTIIMKAFSYEYFNDLIENNYVYLAENNSDIINIINKKEISKCDLSDIWKRNSYENMKSYFDKLEKL